MNYGPYNPTIPSIFKTSSSSFGNSNTSTSNKARSSSNAGRSNYYSTNFSIPKEDSKSRLDHYKEERNPTKILPRPEVKKEIKTTESRASKGIVGFRNLGNTCYMNSVLQCLIRLSPLRDAMTKIEKSDICPLSKLKGKLALSFKNLIDEVRSSNNFTAVTPYEVKNWMGNFARQFSGCEQQDSSEFLRCFLEALSLDLNRVVNKTRYNEMTGNTKEPMSTIADRWWAYSLSRENSLITDCFQGQLASVITCNSCGYGSISCDCFLSLNLPSPESSYRAASLDECLSLYFQNTALPSSYKCEKCKNSGHCKQNFSLYRLPKVIIFQLKRFQVTAYSKQRLNTEISFPEELSLNKFKYEQNTKETKYVLCGISHHMGSLNFGHYIANCKEDGGWYCFDDSRVFSIEVPSRSTSAYILFYVANF